MHSASQHFGTRFFALLHSFPTIKYLPRGKAATKDNAVE